MKIADLTVDPRGLWSPRQAYRVMAILDPQLRAHKLWLVTLDVTTFDHPGKRLMLVACCIEHEISVPWGGICKMCARHVKES